MSNTIFFISDLHLGHKRACEFPMRPDSDHDQWIVDGWNSVVRAKDIVYILGDLAFSADGIEIAKTLRGKKYLVLGNHDTKPVTRYMPEFTILPGLFKYKEFWLSHAPIHPNEMRGKANIHGHIHHNLIEGAWGNPLPEYFNACAEHHNAVPVSLEQVRASVHRSEQ